MRSRRWTWPATRPSASDERYCGPRSPPAIPRRFLYPSWATTITWKTGFTRATDVDTEFDFRVTYLDIDIRRARRRRAAGADHRRRRRRPARHPFPDEADLGHAGRQRARLSTAGETAVGEFRCEIVAQDAQGGAPAANVRPTQIVVRPAARRRALTCRARHSNNRPEKRRPGGGFFPPPVFSSFIMG